MIHPLEIINICTELDSSLLSVTVPKLYFKLNTSTLV